jgi:hypothetical protein
MSESMIERVALAIERTMFADHELPCDPDLHKKYRGTARAAIEAMREPTTAMIDSGVAFALNVSLGGDYKWSDYVADKHRAMIAAALSSEKEGKGTGASEGARISITGNQWSGEDKGKGG